MQIDLKEQNQAFLNITETVPMSSKNQLFVFDSYRSSEQNYS